MLHCNNDCFYCIFCQINAALVSIRDFFEKYLKISADFKLMNNIVFISFKKLKLNVPVK